MTYHSQFGGKSKNSDASAESPRALTLRIPLVKKRKAYELAKKRRISLSRLVETLLDDYRDFRRH
ncbi:MAG: hypothetical protein WC076_07290 [Terrimicrobiaceae bacterium]|nr:hypothetical protein [Terrimicrobiaceae bacterium]